MARRLGIARFDGPTEAARRARFDALYDAQVNPLLAYAYRRVDHPEDAADVVAETLLIAWRRLDAVPEDHEARYWLLGVARRVLSNHRRSNARRQRLGERLRDDLRRVGRRDHTADVETGVVVATAMEGLRAADREVLQLAAWEGLGSEEIALVLGISSAAARARLHRARGRLRDRLRRMGWAAVQQPPPSRHWGHDDDPLVRNAEDEP